MLMQKGMNQNKHSKWKIELKKVKASKREDLHKF